MFSQNREKMISKDFILKVMSVLIASTFILAVVLFARNANHEKAIIKESNSELMQMIALNVEMYFMKNVDQLTNLSFNIEEYDLAHEQHAIDETIKKFKRRNDVFASFLLLGETGTVVYTYPNDHEINGVDLSTQKYFDQVIKGNDYFWTDTFYDNEANHVGIKLAIPIKNGVFVSTIHLDKLNVIIQELSKRNDVRIEVVDQNKFYVSHPDTMIIEQRWNATFDYILDESWIVTVDDTEVFKDAYKMPSNNWTIYIFRSTAELRENQRKLLLLFIMLFGSVIIIASALLKFFTENFKLQFRTILQLTGDISNGERLLEYPEFEYYEFVEMMDAFKKMVRSIESGEKQIMQKNEEIETMNKELEIKVRDRTADLNTTNQELEISLENLHNSQEKLIDYEKMKSTKIMITGIAHELNTPIGNAFTTLSFLRSRLDELLQIEKEKEPTNEKLNEYLSEYSQSCELMNSSLKGAIGLIEQFKRINVEVSNKSYSSVDIDDVLKYSIEEIKKNNNMDDFIFQITSKHVKAKISMIDLSMIFTSIIMNSFTHGYENKPVGIIEFEISEDDIYTNIIIKDYGIGIEEKNLQHIFEPFFTGANKKGNLGLGLSIVNNIVKMKYGGIIEFESEYGKGTSIEIKLPRK